MPAPLIDRTIDERIFKTSGVWDVADDHVLPSKLCASWRLGAERLAELCAGGEAFTRFDVVYPRGIDFLALRRKSMAGPWVLRMI